MTDGELEYEAAPSAASLIEGLRDFGYTLETALADVVDNSISAGARNISILTDTDGANPKLAVLDDGHGMSELELRRAMRPGAQNPLDVRDGDDLGRFGLGLKTASFSQCRRLSVMTRRDGHTSTAAWDLDRVADTDRWVVQVPRGSDIPWAEELTGDGTLVVWEDLDRIVGDEAPSQVTAHFNQRLVAAEDHLGLVFHRFLSREGTYPKVAMRLNYRDIRALDPFHSRHPATIRDPEEVFPTLNGDIRFQAYTLPHHNKVTPEEWERYAGAEGYVRNQGFYVYRSRRLIVRGTWFGLARQSELTKLSRVRIDLPNSMDEAWKINVLKAAAQPPPNVRARLRQVIDRIGGTSKRVYRRRGVRQASETPLPVWERELTARGVSYRVSTEHPALLAFVGALDAEQQREFLGILSMIGAGLPMDALLNDLGDSPEKMQAERIEDVDLRDLIRRTVRVLRGRGLDWSRVEEMMAVSPPFDSQWEQAAPIIQRMSEEPDEH